MDAPNTAPAILTECPYCTGEVGHFSNCHPLTRKSAIRTPAPIEEADLAELRRILEASDSQGILRAMEGLTLRHFDYMMLGLLWVSPLTSWEWPWTYSWAEETYVGGRDDVAVTDKGRELLGLPPLPRPEPVRGRSGDDYRSTSSNSDRWNPGGACLDLTPDRF